MMKHIRNTLDQTSNHRILEDVILDELENYGVHFEEKEVSPSFY